MDFGPEAAFLMKEEEEEEGRFGNFWIIFIFVFQKWNEKISKKKKKKEKRKK